MRLHDGQPTRAAGEPLEGARAALLALHGRGATAEGLLEPLAAELGRDGLALLAPQARHGTWYPRPFLAPFEANQPWLDSALALVAGNVAAIERAGVAAERIVFFGFSQGACLAAEFVARNPRRWGGLIAATGGRIGPPGTRFDAGGDLAGTPVHLSAGDPDPHVPWSRVEESAASLRAQGAAVEVVRAPGLPHTVHPSALEFAQRIVDGLLGS